MQRKFKLFNLIVFTAMIMLGITACGDGGGNNGEGSSKSVELTANASGGISISYSGDENMTVTVTTDLPAPNDSFTMNTVGETKAISGLTPGQKVNVKVTVSGTVSKFVAMDGDQSQSWFQVYKK